MPAEDKLIQLKPDGKIPVLFLQLFADQEDHLFVELNLARLPDLLQGNLVLALYDNREEVVARGFAIECASALVWFADDVLQVDVPKDKSAIMTEIVYALDKLQVRLAVGKAVPLDPQIPIN